MPSPEGDPITMPAKKSAPKPATKTVRKAAAKKAAPRKVAAKPPTPRKVKTITPVPVLEPAMMNDLLRAIYNKARSIDAHRERLEALIAESDELVLEAVDEGERYRDIAAAAGRTVPWVQMSLRRIAGVSTHPAEPLPTRIRKAPRRAS